MSLYKQPGSDVWWASVEVNGQRVRRSTGEYDKAAAQKVHDRLKAAAHDQPRLKGRTWGDAVLAWTKAEERSESDLLSLVKFGTKYRDRLLINVTAQSLEQALSFCQTPGTYNRYVARINAILRLSGAALRLAKKREVAATRDWITHEQWNRLYAELPRHLRPAAQFAVSTGLRQANVFGLRWDHVDLNRRHVWTDAVDSKSGQPISTPLNDDALRALGEVKGQHDEWCFTYRGKPFKDVKTAFMAACVRAGVGKSTKQGYVGFSWHGLRHTWATWHVQNGTPLEVIRILGGWSDLRMVTRYSHHSAGFVAQYVNNTRGKK